ncbi:MAG: metallophosphoesterase [Sphingobacteriales bacterium]|nr:MAG: metallophosphoesterase [Sphingobacteriales bacterium]
MYNSRICALLVCISILCNAQAQTLLRGPYLQSLTNKSIKVMWRTSEATASVLRYGSHWDSLNQTIIDTTKVKDHIVLISGLQAKTEYFYQVGYDDAVLASRNEQHHFYTAPNPNDTNGFKFWVTGDFGAGNNEQIKVKNWFQNYLINNKVDSWLWLGDNTYNDGKDQEYQTKVFSSNYGYDSIFRFLPFYPIPGNHDYASVNQSKAAEKHTGPYYSMVEVFKNAEMGGVPSKTEAYYSYDYGNVHFMALNSELYTYMLFWDLGNPYRTWIENDIKSSDKLFKVAYWHQAPYSKGSHDTDDFWEIFMQIMREKVTPILEKWGVDLILSGHSHVYERSYLINNHYGRSNTFDRNTMLIDSTDGNPDSNRVYIKLNYGEEKNKGTVYAVVGNSGKTESPTGKMHPVMCVKDDNDGDGGSGSMILEAKGNQLTGNYYKSSGELYDKFRIIKQDTTIVSSIKSNTYFDDFNVYPNPFSSKINIELSAKKNIDASIYLQNLNGQIQRQKVWEGKALKGNQTIEVDGLENLASGSYIIYVIHQDEIISQKIIKF